MRGPANMSEPVEPEVTIHRGPGGARHLAQPWRGLEAEMRARSFVHAYEWHSSFLDTQEPDPEKTLFAAVSTDGALQAILPLRPVRRPVAGLGPRGLEVPVNPHVPFTDIVARDPDRVRAIMPSVLRKLAEDDAISWDYLAFRRTPGDSLAARSLLDTSGFPAWSSEAGSFHHIPVRTFDALFGALSSRFRNNLRRAQKRAGSLGGVTYHTATSPDGCEALFKEFLEVEASGWKGEGGTRTAIALDPGLRTFYAALMERFACRGRCRIDVLRHGGRPIAAAFQLATDGTLYGLKIGFDESYARIAPGNLLHWHIFRSVCEDPRFHTYNMVSDAAWHTQWRPLTSGLLDVVIFRPGLAGRIANVEQQVAARTSDWGRRAVRRWLDTRRGRRRFVRGPQRGA